MQVSVRLKDKVSLHHLISILLKLGLLLLKMQYTSTYKGRRRGKIKLLHNILC